jgi:hypothetical protein
MTKHFRPRNRSELSARLGRMSLAAWLIAWGGADAQTKGKSMKHSPLSLWQVVAVLTEQPQYTKAKIEGLLPVTLVETNNAGGNEIFQFFKSDPVLLNDGSVILNIDLRIKRQGSHPGFLVLELGGTCVPLEEVRGHYGDLQITDTPHGHSLDEKTSYTAYLPWGELSFGFAERNPDCLASIVFEPKKGGM